MINCAGCGTPATGDVKFCRKCGASLRGDGESLQPRSAGERFDWSRTWVADMLLTSDERERRRAARELSARPEDLAAIELKEAANLQKEIKNGVITTVSGIGVTIFLLVFMGTIAAMQPDPRAATMLGRLWVAGLIPLLVGIGMLVNAFFVSGRFSKHRLKVLNSVFVSAESAKGEQGATTGEIQYLDAPPSVVPSVVEHTTHRLVEPEGALRGNPSMRTDE